MERSKKKEVNIEKLVKTSFFMNGIQLILVFVMITYNFMAKNQDMYTLIYSVLGITIINTLISIGSYYFSFTHKKDYFIDTIKNLEELNGKLREQRHDYLNHLQVIYGLIALEEYEEAKHYMEPVYKDIIKVSKALKTSHPAINALLQAKIQVAQEQGIDMSLEIKSNLKYIPLEPWELCKVVANIIDNGIRALREKEEGNKKLYLDISEKENKYSIHIYNNGPPIPHYYLRDIFKEGFSTKKEEGHGIGLFIAKSIIEKAGGTIEAASSRDKTYFSIELPKSI